MDSTYIYHNPDAAASKAGPLKGIRIAVQPNISVSGWPADAGSKALANFKALEDATLVRRLNQAGAALCGSTRMSEFGFGLYGSNAGGAIKRQSADAELVLDMMGESRLAALRVSACGFKPSYGLISRIGLIGLIPSMECCGLLSGSLANIREILKTIAGRDELDFSQPDDGPLDFSSRTVVTAKTTIGFIKEAQSALSKESEFRSAIDGLKKAGFSTREMSLPDFDLFSLVHKIVGSVEASSCAGRYDSVRYGQRMPSAKNWNEMYLLSRGAAFGPLLKSYLFQGAFFQFEQYGAYVNACRIRARLLADMQQLFSQADFLIFPLVSGSEAPALLADTYNQFASTLFANVAGLPALYLAPLPGGAPSGFQLVGPRLSDARLLALAEDILDLRRGGS
ncbi:MAG: hypothetical protein JXA73_16145 [Acidobacteria bacterium]|nr:hypothetical protein [Acidobacteriota bacterium]